MFSREKSISRNNPLLPIENFPSFVLRRDVIMLFHLIIQVLAYGSLKVKENFKPFFLKVVAAVYDLQEVVEIGGLTALFDWTRKGRGYKGFFYLTIQERSLN